MPDVIMEEYYKNSKKLYILFGGIAAGMGMPPFEFCKASKILEENKIFIRDYAQCWYQCGLPGIGKNAFEVGCFLKKKIECIGPEDLFFIGNSMGGYAAISFASMIGYGKVIAFSPQTFISPFKLLIYRDGRWKRQIFNTYKATFFRRPKPILDIKRQIERNGSGYTVMIHVSTNDKLDLLHAQRIEKFKNIFIHKYDVAGHDLVKYLRDTNKLESILRNATI